LNKSQNKLEVLTIRAYCLRWSNEYFY
jgi:hypothetical protein